ncbi:MAG: hypothetical protein ACYS0I_16015 [Planctomycetota bacterium]
MDKKEKLYRIKFVDNFDKDDILFVYAGNINIASQVALKRLYVRVIKDIKPVKD